MAQKTARRELEKSTKDMIVGMNIAGQSGLSIAAQLNLAPTTVKKVIR